MTTIIYKGYVLRLEANNRIILLEFGTVFASLQQAKEEIDQHIKDQQLYAMMKGNDHA